MDMERDLNNPQFVGKIISEITSTERSKAQEHAFKAFRIYQGELESFVQEELKEKRPKSWEQYTLSDISVSSMVINKIAKSYKDSPKRIIQESQDGSQVYHDILNSVQADRHFNEFDQIFNLHREALMWVNWRETDQAWQMIALAPYEYSLVRNKDTGKVEVVILHYPSNRVVSKGGTGDGKSDLIAESQNDSSADFDHYAIWTDEQHVQVQAQKRIELGIDGKQKAKLDIDYVEIQDNPNNINPLGVLPFVYLSKDVSPDNPYPNPITDQTVKFNVMVSELLGSATLQGTGQLVLRYPEKYQGGMEISTGLTTAVELPQSSNPDDAATDASYINPNPDLAGQKDAYLTYLKWILSQQGIVSAQGIEGDGQSFSSGIERMIAQADVQDIRATNQMLYSGVEKGVFDLFKVWSDILGFRFFKDEDELLVYFEKPKVMISDAEILANIEKRMSLGLMERWEALMILNPNLSEESARERVQQIDFNSTQIVRGIFSGRQGDEDSQAGSIEGSGQP